MSTFDESNDERDDLAPRRRHHVDAVLLLACGGLEHVVRAVVHVHGARLG
jgi:hypothetical protein